MSKKYDLLFRLLLCGDSAVGKSCILWRFADDDFNPNHLATIGIDFKLKTLDVDGKTVKIQCWDTAGQERYESLSQSYYRRAEGIILAYDITRMETFVSLQKWLKFIKTNAPEEVEVVLVGNKSDKEELRAVSTQQGLKLAQANGFEFFETSAYSSCHVQDAFHSLVRRLLYRKLKPHQKTSPSHMAVSKAEISLQTSSSPSSPRSLSRCRHRNAASCREPSPDSLLKLKWCMDGPSDRSERTNRPNSFLIRTDSEFSSSEDSEDDPHSPPAASRQKKFLHRSMNAIDILGFATGSGRFTFRNREDTNMRRQSSLIRLERKLSSGLNRTDSGRSVTSDGHCRKNVHDGTCCKML